MPGGYKAIERVIALLACLLLAGCTQATTGLFRNVSNSRLTLHLRTRGADARIFAVYELAPGEVARGHLHFHQEWFVYKDRKLLHAGALGTTRGEPYGYGSGAGRMDFLVNEDGLFAVPAQWRKNWRERIDDILAGRVPPDSPRAK